MPVQGFVRLRKHQFGRQSAWGNAEPATRAYPFSGVPSVNLNWTDPEGDFGSLFPIAAPHREAPDITASLNAPVVNYNDLPLMLAGVFGGDERPTGSGTSQMWAWTPAALTADDFDLFTYEFGDDVTTDWYQLTEGIITQLTFNGPDNLGPVSASMNWLFAQVASTAIKVANISTRTRPRAPGAAAFVVVVCVTCRSGGSGHVCPWKNGAAVR